MKFRVIQRPRCQGRSLLRDEIMKKYEAFMNHAKECQREGIKTVALGVDEFEENKEVLMEFATQYMWEFKPNEHNDSSCFYFCGVKYIKGEVR